MRERGVVCVVGGSDGGQRHGRKRDRSLTLELPSTEETPLPIRAELGSMLEGEFDYALWTATSKRPPAHLNHPALRVCGGRTVMLGPQLRSAVSTAADQEGHAGWPVIWAVFPAAADVRESTVDVCVRGQAKATVVEMCGRWRAGALSSIPVFCI